MPDYLRFDYLSPDAKPWVLSVVAVLALAIIWLVVRFVRRRRDRLRQAFNAIGFDRVEGLIIPSVDDGEIQVDQLLLTSRGLLIVDIKDVQGVVFGSDKMQDWAVINNERRYTFSNPQPALYDRIAAVRQIVHGVPVSGRILFLDGADFAKGVPANVCGLDELVDEFGEEDKRAARQKIEAFRRQLEIAKDCELPVFLHQRDAHDDFIEVLEPALTGLSRAVAHCFTGEGESLHEYLALGLYIGITGWICDERRGQHLHDIVSVIPDDRLLIETDAPYLLPRTLRPRPGSRRNEPAYLTEVLKTVAEARSQSLDHVARITTQNALQFFNLPVS